MQQPPPPPSNTGGLMHAVLAACVPPSLRCLTQAACVLLAFAGLAPVSAQAQTTLPTVTVTPGTSPVTEGTMAEVTFSRTGPTTSTLRVSFSLTETGDMIRGNFQESQGFSFQVGQSSATSSILTEDDSEDEDDSIVTFALTADAAYAIGTPGSASITVEDNDEGAGAPLPMVTLVLTPDSISEDGGVSTVKATLNRSSSADTVVTVTVLPVAPATAGDYRVLPAVETLELTIPAGDTESTETAMITALDNSVDAPDKQVTVSATAANLLGITDPDTVTLTITDDDNGPPTGAPTISDTTPTVGDVLTVDTSGIGDPDGLTSPTFTWRWIRVATGGNETDIGTDAAYTVVAADEGAKLKVEVSFTDDGGTTERVESAETAAVEAARTLPIVAVTPGTTPVEEGTAATFTVTRTGVTTGALTVNYEVSESEDMVAASEEGAKTVAFGATDTEVTITVPTEDDSRRERASTVTVELTADPAYELGAQSSATVTVEDGDNSPPTRGPSLENPTPEVGDTIESDPSAIIDPDGVSSDPFRFQWVRVSSDGAETVVGTEVTYTVTDADVGSKLKARVSYTDAFGTVETADSPESAVVPGAPLPLLSVTSGTTPVPEGTAATFTVTRTVVTTGALTVNYSVSENGAMVASDQEGAQSIDFSGDLESVTITVPTEEDSAHEDDSTVTVTLEADDAYDLGTPTAEVTVEDDDNAAPTGAPTITGTPTVGETLTANTSGIADADGLAGATFTWQWIRVSGGTGTPIGGETSATYTVVSEDVGATLKVAVSFTDDDGTAERVESTETAAVEAAAPKPTVTVARVASPVTEGENAQFTVTRTVVTTGALTVSYSVSETEDMVAASEEGSKTIDFSGDADSVTIKVPTEGDSAHEADSTVTVTLEADAAYTVGTDGEAEVEVADDDNGPPTGFAVISDDTPEVGDTLTADTSGIADPDGLTTPTFTYRWFRVGTGGDETDIGTGATYRVVAGDVGWALNVAVTFTDDGGTEETVGGDTTWKVAAAPLPTTKTTFISNLESDFGLIRPQGIHDDTAQTFETGSRSGGYSIEEVVVRFHDIGSVTPRVTIRESQTIGTRQLPDAVLHTLTPPSSLTIGENVFTAPAGARLAANTVYHLVVEHPGSDLDWEWSRVPRANLVETDLGGFDIDFDFLVESQVVSGGWAGAGNGGVLGAAIRGSTETPTPTPPPGALFAAGEPSSRIRTQYRLTTEVDLAEYLAEGVTAGDVTFGVSCDATSGDYYSSVSVSGNTLRLTTNRLGHTHGPNSETSTSCDVTATTAEATDTATFRFEIPRASQLFQVPEVSVVGRFEDALEIVVTDPSRRGPNFLRLGWRKSGSGSWEQRIMSGAGFRSGSVPTIRLSELDANTEYEIRAQVMRYVAFDLWAQGRTIAEGVLTEPATGLDPKWLRNLNQGGASRPGSATARTGVNTAPTGLPTIDDTDPATFETLTASASGIADADGLTNPRFTWQWIRVSDGSDTRISGATEASYTVVAADLDATLKVEVRFTDDGGKRETLESAETTAVVEGAPINAAPAGRPAIRNQTPTVGDTLTVDISSITDADGLRGATFTYTWFRVATDASETEIGTNSIYTVVAADVGATLKVRVSFTDDGGADEALESDETATVVARAKPSLSLAAVTTPVTEGTDAEFTLTRTVVTTGALTVYYSVSETSTMVAPTDEGPKTIRFAEDADTFTITVPTEGDATHETHSTVTVTLTADAAYDIGTGTDTVVVEDDDNAAPTGLPTISDTTPVVGQELTAITSAIADGDGLLGGFTYRWFRTKDGATTPATEKIVDDTYTVVAEDEGATLKVTVEFVDADGTPESLTSAATAVVTAVPKPSLSVARVASPVAEGANAEFTVTRTVVTTGALTVNYEVSENGDMVASGGEGSKTIAFSGSETSVTITVATEEDTAHEDDSTVTVTLTVDDAYDIGTGTDTVLVEDDDNAAPTGVPVISDASPGVGDTLTVDTSGIGDPDGLTGPTFTYRWLRVAFDQSETVVGTDATYTVVLADHGSALKVEVGFTDDDDNAETVQSVPTAGVVKPTVSATAGATVAEGVAATFTVTRSRVTAGELTVEYRIAETGEMVAAADEGDRTVTFDDGEMEKTITVATEDDSVHEDDSEVTLTVQADDSYDIGSGPVEVTVEDDDNAAPTGAATISDTTPVVGEVLTAITTAIGDPDGLTGPTFTYQWLRVSGGTATNITGAASATYTVVSEDVGATLKVRVGFDDDDGTTESLDSAETDAVLATAPIPTVSVAAVASPVAEGEGAQFTVTRAVVTTGALTVNYEVSENGDMVASGGEGSKTIAFSGSETSVTITVATEGDGVHEADSTVTVTLAADDAYDIGTGAATVTVEDDDNAAPTGAPTISEQTPVVGDTLTVDTSGIGDPDGLTTPTFTYRWFRVSDGTATAVTEVISTNGYTVVAADEGATLKVRVFFTDDDETRERIESAETGTVEAAPVPSVSVALVSSPVSESAGAQFTLTRSVVTTGALTVNYEVSENGDMVASSDGGAKSVDFGDGETEKTITVAVEDDSVHEDDSTVTLTLTADAAYKIGTASAEVIVEDDDNAAPTGALTIDDTTPVVGEILTADPSGLDDPDGLSNRTFTWQWVRVSGGNETDIANATGNTYTVVSEDVGATLKVKATFTDDDDADETVASAETGTVEAAPAPSVSAALVSSPVSESAGAQFTLTRSVVTTGALTVNYEVSENGDMVASSDEGAKSVGFGDGETEKTITVAVEDDSVHEDDSTVTLTLTADDAYEIGTASAEVIVEDDDNAAPTGAVTITGAAAEGETLTADASALGDPDGLTGAVFAYQWLRVASDDAETPIGGATSNTYTVVAADVGATLKVEVGFTDDDGADEKVESAETAVVAAAPKPTVSVAAVSSPVAEGEGAQFTVTRAVVTAGALTVRYEVSEDGDMVASGEEGDWTSTFSGAATSVTITVPTEGDGAHEADSVVTLTLTADAAYEIGTASAEVVVEDDDNAAPTGVPTISDTTPAVGDALTAITSGVGDPDGLTNPTFTYRWIRVAADDAETPIGGAAGVGYTVAAEDVGATLKVAVGFTDDEGHAETVESAETAVVAAAAPTTVSVARVSSPVAEGADAQFRVMRAGVTTGALTVNYEVSESGAMVASSREGAGSVVLGDGDAQAIVTVPTQDDGARETDSVVTLRLTADAAYAIGSPSSATVTVEDDDDGPQPPTVTVARVSGAVEEGGFARFRLRRSGATAGALTVNYEVSESGAMVAAGDEGAKSVVLSSGEASREVAVPTQDDGASEADSRVTVRLTADAAYELGSPSSATVTVEDDEPPLPTLTVERVSSRVEEGGFARFRLRRSGAAAGALTVNYEVSESGAMVAAGDEGARSVAFRSGETRRNVTVPTVDDGFSEADSVVTLALAADAAYILGSPSSATVTAEDNDEGAPPPTVVAAPYLPPASAQGLEGFMRIVNHSGESGEVSIEAIDDAGVSAGVVTLPIAANASRHFNVADLERGNPRKGFAEGVGAGQGGWRLVLGSALPVTALAYVRAADGLVSPLHDVAPAAEGGGRRVAFFNPASNLNQMSSLRLVNLGGREAQVTVAGTDSTGAAAEAAATVALPAGGAAELTAAELEAAIGDGRGKWRLAVRSPEPVLAMSLLSSPTGHLTNLSTVPARPGAGGAHVVPLFLSASDAFGRQGFVRVVNRSAEAGEVTITAHDDSDFAYDPVALAIGAGRSAHFNSDDLELGNAAKGLTGSTGPSAAGDWRLELASDLDIEVLAYVRTPDGFLTSVHDVAPTLADGSHWVAFFNPASNANQASSLRLVNRGPSDAVATVTGIDARGESPGGAVTLSVPAGASRTVTASELENGAEGLEGALGDGSGKWRLRVVSDRPILVMSLLASPAGHLVNISSAPGLGVR